MQRTTATYELAEGPRWVEGRWVFVDIPQGALYELDDGLGVRELARLDVPLGAVAHLSSGDGWLAAAGTGIARITPAGVEWLDKPEDGAPVAMRMNDAVCDLQGRMWAGSLALDVEEDAGSLYRVDADGSVQKVLDGLTIPNGPGFSPDGRTMYLADSPTGIIRTYPLDPGTGTLGDGTVFAEVTDGHPDGMVVDDEGHLWVSVFGGGRVARFDPGGAPSGGIDLPSSQPTAPCFGGPDGRRLLVTTAYEDLDDPGEHDGAVWLLDAPVSGPPSRPAAL
jgi:sugar lactone lactonase YvrE